MVWWQEVTLTEMLRGKVNSDTLSSRSTTESYATWLRKEEEAGNWILSYQTFRQIELGPGIRPICDHHRHPFGQRFKRFEAKLKKVALNFLMGGV